jgi:ribosomal protein S27AE
MPTRVCPNCGEKVDGSSASVQDSEGDEVGKGQGKQERATCPNCNSSLTRAAGKDGPWVLAD